ncbi:MAG: hypothetical protein V2A59_02745 [Candidatus Omnitrophota bacterium]
MIDRRVFQRIAASFPIKFWDLKANNVGEAKVDDVSASGVGFTSSDNLTPGVSLGLWLEIPDNGERLYLHGAVAESRLISQNKYHIGVKLVKPELMGISRVLRLNRNFA